MSDQKRDLSVITENIAALRKRGELNDEQKRISIELLANELYKSLLMSDHGEKDDTLYSRLQALSDDFTSAEYIELLNVLLKNSHLPQSFFPEPDDSFDVFSSKKAAKISYVKNNYIDAAFMRFSGLFENPKVSYGASFDEICEGVYNSVCDYCILPIENSANGKLLSFYSLIDKYDLKIFAVCDLDEGASGKRTRYALLSRKKLILLDKYARSYLEFSIVGDQSYMLSDILEAAGRASLKLYRIDSAPVPYDDMTFRFYHVFECAASAPVPFFVYLNHKYPQHKTVGHYILL